MPLRKPLTSLRLGNPQARSFCARMGEGIGDDREEGVNEAVVGVLHPAKWALRLIRLLTHRANLALWASSKSSAATDRRAHEADPSDVGSVDELARRSAIVVSVCSPHAATDLGRSVARFEGLFVDMNAVSPAITAVIEAGGGLDALGMRSRRPASAYRARST